MRDDRRPPRMGAADLAQLAGLLGPGMLYVKLATPLGSAVVDPFASAQDPTTQRIMQRLGIQLTVGFGPAPAPEPGETNLFDNLMTGVPLALGAVVLWLRPRWSTALAVGAAYLLLNSGALAQYFAAPVEA
jgi:hypothetical protein